MAKSPLVRMPLPLAHGFSRLHRSFVQLSGGRAGMKFRGQPLILLTTKGRKTGKARTWPLCGLPIDGEHPERGWVVVGSNGGHDTHPAWYLNLQADPIALVQDGTSKREVRARDATAEERARHWPRFVELLGTYAEYQEATDRQIPIVLLEPVA
jgi:deazaflavin-dependent oxidoreductase (nitroreductase family)